MEPLPRIPLIQALRVYWLNLLAIFLTPAMTVAAMIFVKPLWPVVFISLAFFATIVPYRLGKAPTSYLIICQLVFVLGGFFVPLIGLVLWKAGVPEDLINRLWAETSK